MASLENDLKQSLDTNAAHVPQESLFVRLTNEFKKPEYEPFIAFTKLALMNGKSILSDIARDLMKPYDWAKRIGNLPEQYQDNRDDGYSIPASATSTGAGVGATIGMGYVATSFYKAAQFAAIRGATITPHGWVALAVLTAVQTERAQKLTNDLVRTGVDAIMPGSELKERKEESESLNLSLSSPEFEQYLSEQQKQLNNLLGSFNNALAQKIDTKEDAMAASADAMKQNPGNSNKAKDKDEKLTQEKKKVSELKKQAEGIKSSVQTADFVFNEEFVKNIQTFAEKLGYTGLVVSEISQAAISLGGHQRTWKDIAARGMGAYKVYTGFAVACTVGGGPLGALMMFNGLMDMISGAQENTAYEEIYHALSEIKGILIQGLNQITRQMSEGFNAVLLRLHKITLELDRLEPLISTSFKEIHIKELVDIIDEVKKDIDGEFSLSEDEKRKCLRRLSTWIDRHSKAKIQTSLLRDSKDISKCLELLNDPKFNMSSQLPFLILQLIKYLPQEHFKNMDLDDLPNLTVLADACDVFLLLINHYQFDGNYQPTLQRALKSFETMQNLIKGIKEDNEVWEILYRQYRDLRYKVGRAIFKYRSENPLNNDLSLGEQLKACSSRDYLMDLLDQMEMRRILLQKLAELTECNKNNFETIQTLDKKSDILKRNGEFYQIKANNLLIWATHEKFGEFRGSIINGADINSYDNWGQAIHRIVHHRMTNYTAAIKLLHELFKSGKDVNACHRSSDINSERRWYGVKGEMLMITRLPYTLMMNLGYFDLVMLYCANGYDIPDITNPYSHNYCSNAITWAGKSNWKYYVQYYLVCEMNNEKSFLNKKDLRKAYEYYKAVEAGISVSPENISQDCLLWLTCILGDYYKPLNSLIRYLPGGDWMTKDVMNRTIPNTGFTPLMMAINCNNKSVAYWLIRLGATKYPNVEFDIEKDSSPLMHIAVAQKHFALAKEMRDAKCMVTSDQNKKIEEGLQENQPAPFDSSYLSAVVSNDKANSMNRTEVVLSPQQPTQTLLLINKQIGNLQTALQFLENQPKVEKKRDSEATSINNNLAGAARPLVFSASLNEGVSIDRGDSSNDFPRIFKICELNYTLLNNFITKSKIENEFLNLAKAEFEKLKDYVVKVQSVITDDNLNAFKKAAPYLKSIGDSFNAIDGYLKCDSDLHYPFGDNIHRMLLDLRELLKKSKKSSALKI